MTTSEILLKAAFNRLQARLKKGISYSASETAIFIKEVPKRIKKELNELKKEITEEAERIEEDSFNEDISMQNNPFEKENSISLQNKINGMKKRIAHLTNQVEEIN